jgi:hypothetical protein
VDDRVKTLRAAAKRLLGRGVRDGAATLAHMAADLACEDPEDINEYEFRQLGLLLARLADIDGTRRILDRVDRVDRVDRLRRRAPPSIIPSLRNGNGKCWRYNSSMALIHMYACNPAGRSGGFSPMAFRMRCLARAMSSGDPGIAGG